MPRITKDGFDTRTPPELALLVSVRGTRGREEMQASLDELAELVRTARAEVAGTIVQQSRTPSRNYYVGKGKLEEIIALKDKLHYNLVVFDDELSPQQERNLEDAIQVKIVDRVALILDIFARRARTHEGRLQVELAQHQYLLPRLAGQWSHLERLGGGIGTRGPGESQLETDRRLIKERIQRLKQQLEEVRSHRSLYREQRRKAGISVVSLVGYTNAGKSTLLNAISQAGVVTEKTLFTTLDPTTRRIALPDKRIVLLTDTVGFIRRLPPMIVTAFRATLEELEEASVLVHVLDFASPEAPEHCQTVETILDELQLGNKPVITALNKIDLVLPGDRKWDETSAVEFLSKDCPPEPNTIMISALKGWGLGKLLEMVAGILDKSAGSAARSTTAPD